MVLTCDGQLLTFEDDMQRSGATDRFTLRQSPQGNMEDDCELDADSQLSVEVEYLSKRRAFEPHRNGFASTPFFEDSDGVEYCSKRRALQASKFRF